MKMNGSVESIKKIVDGLNKAEIDTSVGTLNSTSVIRY